MKIALIGATGFVGSAVLTELLNRDHTVRALTRSAAAAAKLGTQPMLETRSADVQDPAAVAAAVAGVDAVVSAYNPGWNRADIQAEFVAGTRAIYAGVRASGVRRLLVVGGAGSLYVAPGVQLVDTPEFPAQWKQGALAAREALTLIRAEDGLDWSFVSPPPHLEPGERSGRYRLGLDSPVVAADGQMRISVADLAVAIADELERPQHLRRRFTVGY